MSETLPSLFQLQDDLADVLPEIGLASGWPTAISIIKAKVADAQRLTEQLEYWKGNAERRFEDAQRLTAEGARLREEIEGHEHAFSVRRTYVTQLEARELELVAALRAIESLERTYGPDETCARTMANIARTALTPPPRPGGEGVA